MLSNVQVCVYMCVCVFVCGTLEAGLTCDRDAKGQSLSTQPHAFQCASVCVYVCVCFPMCRCVCVCELSTQWSSFGLSTRLLSGDAAALCGMASPSSVLYMSGLRRSAHESTDSWRSTGWLTGSVYSGGEGSMASASCYVGLCSHLSCSKQLRRRALPLCRKSLFAPDTSDTYLSHSTR